MGLFKVPTFVWCNCELCSACGKCLAVLKRIRLCPRFVCWLIVQKYYHYEYLHGFHVNMLMNISVFLLARLFY